MKKLSILVIGLLTAALALLGGCAPAAEGGDSTTSTIYLVVFMVVLFGIFYFFIIRPQQKRQRDQQKMITDLKPGDRVITIGGIIGRIESIKEDSVVLKVESGATIRVVRNGIAGKHEMTD
jgi:preprotein translocase subunit YajC